MEGAAGWRVDRVRDDRLGRGPARVDPGTVQRGRVASLLAAAEADPKSALVYFTNQSKPFSLSLRTVVGGQFGGDRVSVRPTIRYRIGETFRSELTFSYNDYDLPYENGEFTANLARLRLSYSFTPKIQLQALVQYNDTSERLGTNVRFSWLRKANSGFFLVYNEVDERAVGGLPTGREIILKYSQIFDVFN